MIERNFSGFIYAFSWAMVIGNFIHALKEVGGVEDFYEILVVDHYSSLICCIFNVSVFCYPLRNWDILLDASFRWHDALI